MDIGVIGINHKSAPLEVREMVTLLMERVAPCVPVVLLSTCNRTEIYFSGDNLPQMQKELVSRLELSDKLEGSLYSYFGRLCFLHLVFVASGVDSALFGEGQIQGQVRKAYALAKQAHSLSCSLHYLFQKGLKIAKEIRTNFSLPKGKTSLGSVIWDLARCFYLQEEKISLLLVGNSEVNRALLPFLISKNRFAITLVTKDPTGANELETRYSLAVKDPTVLAQWEKYDFVIVASKKEEYLIQPYQSKERSIRTKLIIDLSMPRGVDPAVEVATGVTLLNIQDIGEFLEQRQEISQKEKKLIKEEIEKGVERQIACYFKNKRRAFVCL